MLSGVDHRDVVKGNLMTWTADELKLIDEADDLKIAPFRADGTTYGTPTWIWEVVVDGELYVRGYNGVASRWYQAGIKQQAGRIIAAGMTRDVIFEPVGNGGLNARVDEAYRSKYGASRYLGPMIGKSARAATVRIKPT